MTPVHLTFAKNSLTNKLTFTFYDYITDTEIDIEADGFEEATHIMFGDDDYDPNTCELTHIEENN